MTAPKTGVSNEQADAVSEVFEALGGQIVDLSGQVRRVILCQRIQLVLLLAVTAAVLVEIRNVL